MMQNIRTRIALELLFLIPVDGELERSDGLTALMAVPDARYES